MSVRRTLVPFMAMAVALVLSSCKGAEQVCDPTDPLCGGGGTPTIATITVTSPVDTVMAVGRTVQMSAAAMSSTGSPVSATFVWNSTSTGVGTVNANGLVMAQGTGTTNVQAMAGGQTGSIQMRAVDADLPAVTQTLTDAYRDALAAALSGTPASTLSGLMTTCASHLTSGHVRSLNTCLVNALNLSGTDGNDEALLGVLDLFFAHAQRQLQL
ncbi:MAG: Ig-like domain-containing protein [Gemmatimonadota bacterium]|nr:Ig-like domain-containing protein [Gemmatimonadota bacterium]